MPQKNRKQQHKSEQQDSQDVVHKDGTGHAEKRHTVPIIGIGASAGGLEALKTFFAKAPQKTGMAYIVVMHLAPNQPSMLPELLQRVTEVPVAMAEDGQVLQPDHIYVIPPKKEVSIYAGVIQLLDPVNTDFSLPIDFFFRTLAADKKARAAAVILSGTGTDGSVGLQEIKNFEGLVLVQEPKSAKYDGMPRSALATGLVDMARKPEAIVHTLTDYFNQPAQARIKESEFLENKDWLHKIFALLRVQSGKDFSFYKKNTILRRISRRMVLN